MTISSSLNAGVTGLNVNASKLATISDNIANSATFGYKRSVADFHSLVLDQSRGAYSAGGVRVTTSRAVEQRGTLITTNNPTDLSVAGRGMLPVTPITSVNAGSGNLPLQMTSTGSFRADANGVLRTAGGQALLGWPANKDGTIDTFSRDTIGSLTPVTISANEFDGNPTTSLSLGVNLPATRTAVGASTAPLELPLLYYGNLGEPQYLDISFTPNVPTAPGSPSTNQWDMTVTDRVDPLATATFTITFDSTAANGGTIATGGVTSTPPGLYDPATGIITMILPSGPMEIDIGTYNSPQGLSQLSDIYSPAPIGKNGSPVGLLSSIEVDSLGMLSAIYDSGFTKTLYQIPVVDVPNANGLKALSNQTYEVSGESGAFYLWNAGDGPVGDVIAYSREESATDVASELTQLIQTQRAYNSNAKVIQTVDEMLQETTNIKR